MTKKSQLLDVQESAAFLGLSSSTIRRWAQAGKLKGRKVGSRGDWRFTKDELSRMVRLEKDTFSKVKIFLKEYASQIQKISTQKHEQLVSGGQLPKKANRHRKEHVEVVKKLANNLENFEKGKEVFTHVGKTLAKKAVKEGLTLEEAVDGLIFLKQAIWEKLQQEGLFRQLTADDFYTLSHLFSTYCDILTSQLAFSYQDYFKKQQNSIYLALSSREKKLKEQATLLQLTSDAFIIQDTKNRIVSWNKGAEKLYGYTEKEALGKKAYELIKTEFPISMEKIYNQIKTKGSWNGELTHYTKGGNTITVDSQWQIMPHTKSKLILEVNRDISARKIQEEKLAEADGLNRSILESINDAFYALDKNWNFTYVNTKASQLWGKDRKDLLGKNIWKVFPKAFGSFSHQKHQDAAKTQKPVSFETVSPILVNWIEVNVYPNKTGLSVYFHDITERKKLEQRKDDFIALASHELKTPLTSMKMFTQALEKRLEKSADADAIKLLGTMDTQLSKLTELVNSLLDVSRIQQGKLDYRQEQFSIDDLIEETIGNVQIISNSHTITIGDQTRKKVVADRDRIGQVLINLINNAIKYSPDAHKVIVNSTSKDSQVIIAITDFGVGIPKNQQNKIFDRFFQVNNSPVKTYSGLGLGLYISKEIVERHGGKIWVESEANKGTTFYFSLPSKNNSQNTKIYEESTSNKQEKFQSNGSMLNKNN